MDNNEDRKNDIKSEGETNANQELATTGNVLDDKQTELKETSDNIEAKPAPAPANPEKDNKNPQEAPTNPTSKNKMKIIIVLSVVLAVVIATVAAIIIINVFSPKEDASDQNSSTESPVHIPCDDEDNEDANETDVDLGNLEYKDIPIYRCPDGKLIKENLNYGCDEVAFTIHATAISSVSQDSVVYYEATSVQSGKYKLYLVDTKEHIDLGFTRNGGGSETGIVMSEDGERTIGVAFFEDGNQKNSGYYHVASRRTLYKNEYDRIIHLGDSNLLGGECDGSSCEYILISPTEEKVLLADEGKYSIGRYYEDFYNSDVTGPYYIEFSNNNVSRVYSKNLKLLAEIKEDGDDPSIKYILDGVMIASNADKKITTYDGAGNVIKTYSMSSDEKVAEFDDKGYISVINNQMYVKDYNKHSVKIADTVSDSYSIYLFSYADSETMKKNDNLKSKDWPNGAYYFLFTQFINDECFTGTYYVDPVSGKIEKNERYECPELGKPILYLYPEEETEISITFDHPENLMSTYPKFIDEWKVTALPNGDLRDENGKYYYALYWDEKLTHDADFSTGFYVEGDDAIDFLEDKLSKIGLNDRERNEFIMYWLPIMEKNGKNLVHFELTSEREYYNKLNISPAPDSLLRIAMYIKKVDKKTNIKTQNLPSFTRKGFTVVEWGGAVVE